MRRRQNKRTKLLDMAAFLLEIITAIIALYVIVISFSKKLTLFSVG